MAFIFHCLEKTTQRSSNYCNLILPNCTLSRRKGKVPSNSRTLSDIWMANIHEVSFQNHSPSAEEGNKANQKIQEQDRESYFKLKIEMDLFFWTECTISARKAM